MHQRMLPWDLTLDQTLVGIPHGTLHHSTLPHLGPLLHGIWDPYPMGPHPNDFTLGSLKMEVRTASTTIKPRGEFGC